MLENFPSYLGRISLSVESTDLEEAASTSKSYLFHTPTPPRNASACKNIPRIDRYRLPRIRYICITTTITV